MAEEIGWLVERGGKWWGSPCSRWDWEHALTGCDPPLWTSDASQALRFARKVDADNFIRWESIGGGVTATEHIWMDGMPLDDQAADAALARYKERLTKMLDAAAERINRAR